MERVPAAVIASRLFRLRRLVVFAAAVTGVLVVTTTPAFTQPLSQSGTIPGEEILARRLGGSPAAVLEQPSLERLQRLEEEARSSDPVVAAAAVEAIKSELAFLVARRRLQMRLDLRDEGPEEAIRLDAWRKRIEGEFAAHIEAAPVQALLREIDGRRTAVAGSSIAPAPSSVAAMPTAAAADVLAEALALLPRARSVNAGEAAAARAAIDEAIATHVTQRLATLPVLDPSAPGWAAIAEWAGLLEAELSRFEGFDGAARGLSRARERVGIAEVAVAAAVIELLRAATEAQPFLAVAADLERAGAVETKLAGGHAVRDSYALQLHMWMERMLAAARAAARPAPSLAAAASPGAPATSSATDPLGGLVSSSGPGTSARHSASTAQGAASGVIQSASGESPLLAQRYFYRWLIVAFYNADYSHPRIGGMTLEYYLFAVVEGIERTCPSVTAPARRALDAAYREHFRDTENPLALEARRAGQTDGRTLVETVACDHPALTRLLANVASYLDANVGRDLPVATQQNLCRGASDAAHCACLARAVLARGSPVQRQFALLEEGRMLALVPRLVPAIQREAAHCR